MIISLNQYLNESQAAENNYGCVMLFANAPDWPTFVRRVVKEEDIYTAPDDDYGYEEKAHITVIFGIHDDEVDHEEIYESIRKIPEMRIPAQKIDIFENEDFDVVKLNVPKTQKLLKVRKHFEQFPNTQTFPDYKPHMTIAYVKSGEGQKYKQLLPRPIKFKFDQGVYSEPDYRKTYFDLKSQEGYEK